MKDFRLGGYKYKVIIHTGKKHKYEYIRYIIGLRRQWERISESAYRIKFKEYECIRL